MHSVFLIEHVHSEYQGYVYIGEEMSDVVEEIKSHDATFLKDKLLSKNGVY